MAEAPFGPPYARADAVVAVSKDLAGQLHRLCPAAKVLVLPNLVVNAGFAARMAAPAPHPWLAEPVLLGCGLWLRSGAGADRNHGRTAVA